MVMRVISLGALLAVCAVASGQQVDFSVEVSWPERSGTAPVVVPIREVSGVSFDVRGATVRAAGEVVPCQLDDMDGDGFADELVFLAQDTSPAYAVTLLPVPADTVFPSRVYADMMLSDKRGKYPLITALEAPGSSNVYSDLHHHGPAFESELVAFRIYFDHRQNIDIYGKRQRRLEIPATHFYTTAEQLAAGYGNDVLWAGSSLGCGTLKLWDGASPADWRSVDRRAERILSAGPVRTVVEVEDIGVWLVGGKNTIRTRYILYAGHRDVAVQIDARRPLPAEALCTGVQKVGSDAVYMLRADGLAASWGSDYPEQSSQANKELFPPEAVGLAVYVPDDSRASAHDAPLNALYTLAPHATSHLTYHVAFCADKEAEGYHTAEEWFAWVETWKTAVDNPPRVRIVQ